MNAMFSWVCRGFVLGVLLLTAPLALAQPEDGEAGGGITLKASGLPDGDAPESILPRGAVLHVRVKSAELLLNDVSAMATKFVPEKAVPPQVAKLLEAPNPLLAMIGMQTMRRPLTVEMLGQMSGIDMARPITLSVYAAGPPDKSFVLALPAGDLKAMSQMFSGMTRGSQEVELQGGSALQLRIDGNDVFLVCSKRVVCVAGSRQLAQMLLSAPREERLDRSELVTKAIAENVDANLVVVGDVEPIKPLLGMLRGTATIREPMVERMREQMMREIRPRDLANINLQLKRYLNVRDLEQLLDYTECVLLGSYEVLTEFAFGQAEDFQGIVLALDVGPDLHRFNVTVFSRAIAPSGKPLPIAEAAKAVTKIPGSHNYLLLQGQSAPPTKSKLLGDILKRIVNRSKAKGLPKTFATTLMQAYADYQPEPTLASKVPWTITTQVLGPGGKSPADFPSTQKYLESVYKNWYGVIPVAKIQAIPRQPEGFLAAYYKEYSEVNNKNDQVYRKLRAAANLGEPSYSRNSRFAVRQLPDGVLNMVRETSYTTQWGMFGFNEHELINREFTLCRDAGDITLLYPGGTDPSVLVNFEPQKVPAAIKRLMAELRVPEDANGVEFVRTAPAILQLADLVAAIEQNAHRELAAYLKKVDAAAQQGGGEEEVLARLQAIEMPAIAHQLKQNPDGGFYVLTPIEWTYPRPPVMPEILGLLEEYRRTVDGQGGIASYERQAKGRYDVAMLFSTEAMATLVRSVGNKVAEKYLADRQEMERVQGLLHTPLDAAARRHPTVLTNNTWEFLGGRPMPPQEPKRSVPRAREDF